MLTKEEAQKVLAKLRVTKDQLPKIRRSDSCVRLLEDIRGQPIDEGSVIEIKKEQRDRRGGGRLSSGYQRVNPLRDLVELYFKDRSIVNHHISSFNDFLPTLDNPNSRMQKIVDNLRVCAEDMDRGIIRLDPDKTDGRIIEIRVGRQRDERPATSTRGPADHQGQASREPGGGRLHPFASPRWRPA